MFSKIKNNLINQSLNSPIRTLIISILCTLFIFWGFKNFKVDDDLVKTFPQNMESKLIWDDIQEEFGQTEFIFVAFGKPGYNILNDKWAIAQSQFFTDAILSEISDKVDKVISLSTYNKIDGNNDFLDIGLLQDEDFIKNFSNDEITLKSLDYIRTYLSDNPEQKKRLISSNNDYLNIAIRPIDDSSFSEIVLQVKDLADQYLGDYDIHFAGQPYLAGETPGLIKKDVSTLMLIGIIIMFIILFLNLRSLYAVLIIILTILCSFLAMLGFMGWMRYLTGSNYFDFTMMNTSMPIILLTIANSDGVHIVSRFFRELRISKDKKVALQLTMSSLTQPIFLTSITTSAAFITMIYSPLEYMIGYSLGIAFGVMWALFLSCTMLPSLISIKNWGLNSRAIANENLLERFTAFLGRFVVSKPHIVLFGGLFVVFGSMIGIWFVNVEVNVIKFYKQGNPIRESTVFVDDNFTGTMNLSIKLETEITDNEGIPNYDNYLKLYKLQQFLESNDQISMTFSFADILGQSYKAYTNSDSEFIPSPEELTGTYTMLDYSDKSEIEDDLISLLGENYDDADVGFGDLDKLLVTAMIKTISTAEIQTLIQEIENYIDEHFNSEESNIEISGLSVFINDFVNIIVQSSITSILLSIILILFITGLFFRSIKWGLLSIVPLTSAVILNFGLMGIFGIDLNHMTALLSAVIIGVGVDFSIHYISDYRRNLINKVDVDKINLKTAQDVGYPVLLDVVSNMGFIALLFSILIPLNHMGGLMVFAMISTSFGTLTVLASLIQILKVKKV
ncbi:MMPL family transporter [bacterium]|nr:MMPL family transporter [bacterium]